MTLAEDDRLESERKRADMLDQARARAKIEADTWKAAHKQLAHAFAKQHSTDWRDE